MIDLITYGFYNSKNHDRRYSAIQFGSIFDGIIRDGIYMSIGDCFRVTPDEGMMVLIGSGRAWFNHTWTLNDAPLPLTLPQSEVLLNRIDAIVLDINADRLMRRNDVIIVKGTPSSNPQRPTMIHNATQNQYPLAFVNVNAGTTSIRPANITSMIGTSSTPYVTGILETVNIDALLDQWQDQWNVFFEKQSAEMEKTTAEWEKTWDDWFYPYVDQNTEAIKTWQNYLDSEIRSWFSSLQILLDGDVAVNLANELLNVQKRVDVLDTFKTDLTYEQAIYTGIEDSDNNPVMDSNGNTIGGKIILAVKQ